jgi:hypothetical protein
MQWISFQVTNVITLHENKAETYSPTSLSIGRLVVEFKFATDNVALSMIKM